MMNPESNIVFKGKIFPRSCTICGVFYQSARHYFVHSRKKVACRPKPYTCSKCGRVFNYYWNLIAHEKRKYSCCSKKTSVTGSTSKIEKNIAINDKNIRSHKTNSSFICQKCGALFCYQKSYEKHCKKCKLSDMTPHSSSHFQISALKLSSEISESYQESTKFNSSQINKTSKKVNLLYSSLKDDICNIKNIDQLLPRKLACKEDSTELDIDVHHNQLKHSSANNHSKTMCSGKNVKSFDTEYTNPKDSFNINITDPESQFICKICNYSFISAYTWSKHMKKHPSFKMPNNCFKCPICEEVFYSAYILFRHQKRNQHWKKAHNLVKINEDENNENNKDNNVSEVTSPSNESTHISTDLNSESENKLLKSENKIFHINALTMKLRDRSLIRKKIAKAKLQIKNKTARVSLIDKKPLDRPKCLTCGKFVARSSCNHGKSFSFNECFPCKWCSEQFKTVKRVNYHQQKKHKDRLPFECIQCKQKFFNRSCILNHINQYHKNIQACDVLNEQIISNDVASDREIKEEKNDTHKMEIETKKEKEIVNSINKLVKSSKEDDCNELEQQNLIIIPSDSDNKCCKSVENSPTTGKQFSFKCSVCSQVFYNVTNYVSHSLNHFNSNQLDPNEISKTKPYECEICLEKFTHHQKVQIHFLWHLKTITSPDSKKNTKYNKYQSYSFIDSTFTKARFQIAKKSIFTKVQPNLSINNNKKESLPSLCYRDETYKNADLEQKCKLSNARNCKFYSPESLSNLIDQKISHCYSKDITNNKLNEVYKHIEKINNAENGKDSTCKIKESEDFNSEIKKFSKTNLQVKNVNENNDDMPNSVGSHIKLKICNKNENVLDNLRINKTVDWHLSNDKSYDKQSSTLKDIDILSSLNENLSEKYNLKCICTDYDCASNPCNLYVFPEVNRFLGLSKKNLQTDFENSSITDSEVSKNLYTLRNHFSQLLYLLVNDPELMKILGWGKRNIDDILEDILYHLGQKPSNCEEKLQKLRSNITLLLETCIKDAVIEKLKYSCSSTDDLVINILLLCENSLKT